MKILQVKELAIPEIKVIRFQRFKDERGYFTEIYRQSDFEQLDFMKGIKFTQCNESRSQSGVLRGFHFQLNPFMGKLVRTLSGHMVDFGLDIRKDSPTFGQLVAYDMPANPNRDYDEWIWLPKGFAHGNFYPEDGAIEYFCTGQYNPDGEVGIDPFDQDIDWSLIDPSIKTHIDQNKDLLQSERDQKNISLSDWQKDSRTEQFIY